MSVEGGFLFMRWCVCLTQATSPEETWRWMYQNGAYLLISPVGGEGALEGPANGGENGGHGLDWNPLSETRDCGCSIIRALGPQDKTTCCKIMTKVQCVISVPCPYDSISVNISAVFSNGAFDITTRML